MTPQSPPSIAIACGGTGGHLFPGLAVAEELARHGCAPTLIVSPKQVDQQAVKSVQGMRILTLPAVGLSRGRVLSFLAGFIRSYRAAKQHFKPNPPCAVLAMGGFTAAPPMLAARKHGAWAFVHESNTIPGRANQWLARIADQVFVGFPQAAAQLHHPDTLVTGTPVRRRFQPQDAYTCRVAMGLDPSRPVLLVMGGSQGAGGINDLVIRTLPRLSQSAPELQLLHLAGPNDLPKIEAACRALHLKAAVHSFFEAMELALGAATIAISRAGASSLAELAALKVPCILVPYPHATANHQFHNARAFADTGAARLLEQRSATPESLAQWVCELTRDAAVREAMQTALGRWHQPHAAGRIASEILKCVEAGDCAGECGQPASESGGSNAGTDERERLSLA